MSASSSPSTCRSHANAMIHYIPCCVTLGILLQCGRSRSTGWPPQRAHRGSRLHIKAPLHPHRSSAARVTSEAILVLWSKTLVPPKGKLGARFRQSPSSSPSSWQPLWLETLQRLTPAVGHGVDQRSASHHGHHVHRRRRRRGIGPSPDEAIKDGTD